MVGRFVREHFANYAIGISGKFCFSAILNRSAHGQSMSGRCFLTPLRGNRKSLREINKDISSIPDYDVLHTGAKKKFQSHMEMLSLSAADIEISRTGHVKIVLTKFPNQGSSTQRDVRELHLLIANQMFFFLKDVCHVHQHHDPRQDTMTQVTPFDSAAPHRWVEKTQNSLYREIIRFKRFRNEKALFRASGVISYAKSFERSVGSATNATRLFHTDELETSLAVSREELQHIDQKKIAELDSIRNWFFALFGFIISASFLVRSSTPPQPITVDPSLVALTQFMAANPIPIVFFLIFLSYTTSFLTHRRDPAHLQLVRATLRWLQGFQMRWWFLSSLSITLVCSSIFYLLLVRQFF